MCACLPVCACVKKCWGQIWIITIIGRKTSFSLDLSLMAHPWGPLSFSSSFLPSSRLYLSWVLHFCEFFAKWGSVLGKDFRSGPPLGNDMFKYLAFFTLPRVAVLWQLLYAIMLRVSVPLLLSLPLLLLLPPMAVPAVDFVFILFQSLPQVLNLTPSILTNPCNAGSVLIPPSPLRTSMFGDINWLVQGHTADEGQSWHVTNLDESGNFEASQYLVEKETR